MKLFQHQNRERRKRKSTPVHIRAQQHHRSGEERNRHRGRYPSCKTGGDDRIGIGEKKDEKELAVDLGQRKGTSGQPENPIGESQKYTKRKRVPSGEDKVEEKKGTTGRGSTRRNMMLRDRSELSGEVEKCCWLQNGLYYKRKGQKKGEKEREKNSRARRKSEGKRM